MPRTKMVNGVPTPMTAQEEAERDIEEAAWAASEPARTAARTRLESLDTAISNDTVINTLKSMTAAQFDTWWDNNVTNAAQAIGVLKRLVKLIIFRLL